MMRAGILASTSIGTPHAMVAVVAGEVSPLSSGIVNCGAILACEEAHELRRAREWTTALTQWCEGREACGLGSEPHPAPRCQISDREPSKAARAPLTLERR